MIRITLFNNKNTYSLHQVIIIFLMFLASLNLNNLYFYYIFAAVMTLVVFYTKAIKIDMTLTLLIMFSLSYIVFYPDARIDLLTMVKQFTYPLCYLIGLNILNPKEMKSIKEKQLFNIIVVIAMGAFIHYVLNLLINIDSIERNNIDIWTGDVVTATGQSALAVMAMAVFIAILFLERKFLTKVFAFIGITIIFMYNFILAGRTLIILSMIVLITAFLISNRLFDLKKRTKTIVVFALLILLLAVIYMSNLFGVRDWILGSNLLTRFDLMMFSEDARISLKRLYILNMAKYPFGGGNLRESLAGNYAHELYLDVYSDVGIVGYILVVLFISISIIQVIKVIKSSRCDKDIKLITICVFVSLLCEFWVEPIISGLPWMFGIYCFFTGIIKGFNGSIKHFYFEELK